MEKIIFDTNILIEISKNKREIVDFFTKTNEESIFISPVIYAEFLRVVPNKEKLPSFLKFLNRFNMLHSNVEVDHIFKHLFEKYSLSHQPSIPDMLIAATAIHYNASIFTLNVKDFQFIDGVQLV